MPPKPKSKPLTQYTLVELQKLAKRYKIPYSNKRKAELLSAIRKHQRSKTKPTKSQPTQPKRNQIIKVNRIPRTPESPQISIHTKSVTYDSKKGGVIKECHNNVCKVTKIPPPPSESNNIRKSNIRKSNIRKSNNIQDEELYLPNVMMYYPNLELSK